MNNKFLVLLLILTSAIVAEAQDESRYNYINKYKNIAIQEMERAGIPASIKLAQGILESAAGQSTLARKANNHFGIKCHNTWDGKTYYLEDDDYDDEGRLIKSCFRVYKNAKASYIAHSEFLLDPRKRFRYGFLFTLDPTDYRSWAVGLKRAGYATSPTYAEKLIRVIETYELYRYDTQIPTDVNVPDLADRALGIYEINSVRYVVAEAGELVLEIANRTNTPARCILKFNEKIDANNQTVKENTYVYLQKKRKNYWGGEKWHIVRAGETMFDISQQYAIRLKNLYRRNRLKPGEQPAVGASIKIKGWKVCKKRKPATTSEVEEEKEPWIKDETEGDILIMDPDPEAEEGFGEEFELDLEEEETIDTPAAEPEPVYHIVVKGDTLYSIARKYGSLVETLMLLNELPNTVISTGQRLRIK